MKHTLHILLLLLITLSAHAQHWDTIGNIGFSFVNGYDANFSSVKIDNSGTPYAAFSLSPSNKATVMKYYDGNWVTVGSPLFSAGQAFDLSLALDRNGVPYVTFEDIANANKATVMKFDGSGWVIVGSAGFSAGISRTTSIAFDKNNIPYVAYQDVANGNKATVMKYNGSSWVPLGSVGFSAGAVQFTQLAFDTTGVPYVAYRDDGSASGGKATVMKYSSSSWVNVGSPAFTAGHVHSMSLAIDSSGIPYVAFADTVSPVFAGTVMKEVAGSWVLVGSAGFSLFGARYLTIAINGYGTPYVAYSPNHYGENVMSKKFNGTSWVTVGDSLFSLGEADYTSIAIDRNGTPYVVYEDNSTTFDGATVQKLTLPAITGTDSICIGTGTALSDSITGGTWVNGNAAVAIITPSGYVTGIGVGIDTITYIADELPVTAIITVQPSPAGGSIAGADSVCTGAHITLTDTYTGGTWASINAHATVSSSGVVSGITPGIDTIRYTATNICGTGTQNKGIAIHQVPVAAAITGPATICGTNSIVLANVTAGGFWTVANSHAYATGGIVTGVTPGTDVIRYIVSNECGADTALHNITIIALPDTGIITGPALVCTDAVINLSDAALGAGIWSSSNTGVATVNTVGMVTGITPGTAIISYTVSNGPCTLSAAKAVDVLPVLVPSTTITSTPADSIYYNGQIVTFAANETYGGDAPTYQWYIDGVPQPGDTTNTMWTHVHANISVYCVATSNLPCARPLTDTSNTKFIYGSYLATDDLLQAGDALTVYPNPNTGTFTIMLSSPITEDVQATIINMLGEKVKEFRLPVNKTMKVQLNVVPGVYFLNVFAGDRVINSKIIVH